MLKHLNLLFIAALMLSSSSIIAADAPLTAKFAVIGDSLATGAVTSPELMFDANALANLFFGKTARSLPTATAIPAVDDFGITGGTLPPPRRLWPGGREFRSFYEWVGLNLMAAAARVYLDTEEYSWGYLLGRQRGITAEHIIIAAENGARSERALYQMQRLLAATGGVIPEQVFMMFAGNDLCGYTTARVSTGDEYAQNLERAIAYLLRHGQVSPTGTQITVIAPLAMLQLVDSPVIRAKEIFAHGRNMTCGELQTQQHNMEWSDPEITNETAAALLMNMLPASPAAYCRSLFPPSDPGARGEQLAFIGNRLRSFRDLGRKTVNNLSQHWAKHDANIHINWLDQTAGILFTADDIANDCFHLSVHGQAKLARTILAELDRAE